MRLQHFSSLLAGAALLSACGQSQPAPQNTANAEAAAAPAANVAASNATAPAVSETATPAANATAASATPAPAGDDVTQKLLASLPAPYNTGDVAEGKVQFNKCLSCHTVVKDGPVMTGPNLYGIFGEKAGVRPGFAFSPQMKASAFTWDAAKMDTWITKPDAMIPGTKMTFVGLKDPKQRIDLIAYVKVASSGGPP